MPDRSDQSRGGGDPPASPDPPTRWSLIHRLGHGLEDGRPIDREQWQRDVDDFVRDYRPAVIAVCRVRHRSARQAEQVADRFLGEVIENARGLQNWDPQLGAFRRYLHGWLARHESKQRREDLTREHRSQRGADVHGVELPAPRSSIEAFEAAEQRAFARAVARLALARFLATRPRSGRARRDGTDPIEQHDAWLIARDRGIPLPGEDEPIRLDRATLATRAGIGTASLRNRMLRALRQFAGYLARAIRDTTGTQLDARAELEWFTGMLDDVYPGLREDGGAPW